MTEQQAAELSAQYIRFAQEEARGRSPLYEAFGRGIARDQEAIAFLMTLPAEKQQPNLFLAAVCNVAGTPAGRPQFRQALLCNAEAVRAVMMTHATQTNEPARCATLLPALARLPQPLALVEVGTAAGLCLLPDFYGYDYGGRRLGPSHAGEGYPVFRCSANEATPLPSAMPRIVWRAGLDLNPLDAADPSQAAWLEILVWPGQGERLANLRTALTIAANERPRVVKGDLLGDDLARLCREAPTDATLVVFHTAVLAYVADGAARQDFARRVRSLCRFWIANESPRVFPDIAARAGAADASGRFLLSVNGSPVAWTDPHGAALEWIAGRG
jgi:hypothetical protein